MKTRPILFKGEMVRAILDRRKTQTRRVIKLQPEPATAHPECIGSVHCVAAGYYSVMWSTPRSDGGECLDRDANSPFRHPHGVPGDRLWVRETWRVGAWRGCYIAVDYRASPEIKHTPWVVVSNPDMLERLVAQSLDDFNAAMARGDEGVWLHEPKAYNWEAGHAPTRWRPSIHMPRWASRITLEVTATRVERLQDISEDDAAEEGVEPDNVLKHMMSNGEPFYDANYRSAFVRLWDSIYAARGFGWNVNPWVWVTEFRKVEVK